MNTVIVYGPRGCGKTTNAEALRKHLCCERIVDDWSAGRKVIEGALHLTTDSASAIIACIGSPVPRVVSFGDAMAEMGAATQPVSTTYKTSNPQNPKDAVGARKWRQYATVPATVAVEVGVAMLEGAAKYGRHNYRVAGVRASVYVDAAKGHIDSWWEGEDYDPDVPGQRLSHITKAIASLVVLRDAMIQNMLTDDRPPKANLDKVRADMQVTVEAILDKYPEPKAAFTELNKDDRFVIDASKLNLSAADIGVMLAGTTLRPGTR